MIDSEATVTSAHVGMEIARLANGAAGAKTQLLRAEQGLRDIDAGTATSIGRLREVSAKASPGEFIR